MKRKVSRFNPWITWYFEGFDADNKLVHKGFRSYKSCVYFNTIEDRLLSEARKSTNSVEKILITNCVQLDAWRVK